ncbi:MAG: hypothetical protein COA79_08845 [Planctomycetota bacterium]|nr:MAG: hypothetical protein COA79_08845 [Planctomycetota bacterium]
MLVIFNLGKSVNFLALCLLFFSFSLLLEAQEKKPEKQLTFLTKFHKLKKAPKIDGMLYESEYENTKSSILGFADAEIPGSPINRTEAKLFYDDKNLYISFLCIENSRIKNIEYENDSNKLLSDNYAGMLLDFGKRNKPRYFIILCNPQGVTYTASCKEGESAWNTKWNPTGFICKAQKYVGRWSAELKIPLKEEFSAIPIVSKIGFVRNRYQGIPKESSHFFNSHHSWKPLFSSSQEINKKELVDILLLLNPTYLFKEKESFYGYAYFPIGKGPVKKFPNINEKSLFFEANKKYQLPSPDTNKITGFEISAKQLYNLYGGQNYLVPLCGKNKPVIDGIENDDCWKNQKSLMLGFQDPTILGLDHVNPTKIKIISDKENLYILATCYEKDIKEIRANDKALWTNDILDLAFDIGHRHNHQAYYQIESNAKGRQKLIKGRADSRWKPKSYKSITKIEKDRWVLEIKIGFKDLGIDLTNFPKLWGANFNRTRWPNRPNSRTPGFSNWDTSWRGSPFGTLHTPNLFGHLYFEAGNALPSEVYQLLVDRKVDLKKMNLVKYKIPTPLVVNTIENKKKNQLAKFAKEPIVNIKGNLAEISFAVKEEVDVTVMILNNEGKVIRHLASGVLGENPPSPLKANSLEQKIIWDFKNDSGRKVEKGKYAVRVALGLDAVFDKVLLWTPYEFRNIQGLITSKDGTLYVFDQINGYGGSGGLNFSVILAYDRNGKYLRQVYPFPGNQSHEKVAGALPIILSKDSWIPTMYNLTQHSFYPGTTLLPLQSPAILKDKHLIFLNGGSRWFRTPKRLLKVGLDGSVPADFRGPKLANQMINGKSAVAISPDGNYIYATGFQGEQYKDKRPHHVVYRLKWHDDDISINDVLIKPFIGQYLKRGNNKKLLNDPRGMDVDNNGNIYIADLGNERIVSFDSLGNYINEFKVEQPHVVRVHHKTNAIYVFSDFDATCRITKFNNISGKKLGEVQLPGGTSHKILPGGSRGIMSLDASRKNARLWVAYSRTIIQVDETKKGFTIKGDVMRARRNPKLGPTPRKLARVDFTHHPETHELFIRADSLGGANNVSVYNGSTGEYVRDLKVEGKNFGFDFADLGPDGNFYSIKRGGIHKYDKNFKPIGFKDLKKPVIETTIYRYGNGNYSTFCVSPKGEIAVLNNKEGLHVWNLNGSLIRKNLITGHLGYIAQIVRMDSQGGIYLGVTVRKKNQLILSELQGRLPWGLDFNASPQWHYEHIYGSVLKFKPSGGKILPDPNGNDVIAKNYSGYNSCNIEGKDWMRFGFAPRLHRDTENASCNCEQGSFDLDRFDRLYIPNAPMFHVQVVDRNNNPILRIGNYGNMDAAGPQSSVKDKKMYFAWPNNISVDDKYIYVSDLYNDRIVRGKLIYRKSAEVKIKH